MDRNSGLHIVVSVLLILLGQVLLFGCLKEKTSANKELVNAKQSPTRGN